MIIMARKRGRPKQKPISELIPNFNNDNEIRDYLIEQALYLNVLLIERAKRKNNIKNPGVARAKIYEIKSALEGLKITNSILHDKELSILKEKFDSFELSLMTDNSEANFEFEKLTDEFEKIQQN